VELKRAGSRPVQKGPPEWFTGEVTIEPLSNAPEPSRVGCASVTFQPGARTAWHTVEGRTLPLLDGVIDGRRAPGR
jgi:quercetin dioxygenase-like cupin family protein